VPAANKAADTAFASAGVLKITDFPPGWRTGPNTGGTDSLPTTIPSCARVKSAAKQRDVAATGKAKSSFVNQDSHVASNVYVFATPAVASNAMNALASPDVVNCSRQALPAELQNNLANSSSNEVSSVKADVGALSVAPVGDQYTGIEVVVTAQVRGLSISFYFDELAFRVGRSIAIMALQNTEMPLTDPRDQLVAAVKGRL
jgi:hypothetical protein